MARVVLDGVSKTFRSVRGSTVSAVENFNLQIASGQFVVLLGPSGSGKTTILRMIAGLESVTTGKIWIGDAVVNDLTPKERDVALVQQEDALFPHLTVYENMALGLKLRKVPRAEVTERVDAAAASLGIAPLLSRRPAALSGGERRRVALARVLVRRPRVVLFDEPLAQLDPLLRTQMRAEISRLHSQSGATVVYVTHDHAEALSLADRLVVVKAGTVQQVGGPGEIYRHPANLFVAGFVGSPPMNLFTGILSRAGEQLQFAEERQDATPGGAMRLVIPTALTSSLAPYARRRIILGLRPEKLQLRERSDGPHLNGEFSARIDEVEYTGADLFLYLNTGAHRLMARADASQTLETGATVQIAAELESASFFDPESGFSVGSTKPSGFKAK